MKTYKVMLEYDGVTKAVSKQLDKENEYLPVVETVLNTVYQMIDFAKINASCHYLHTSVLPDYRWFKFGDTNWDEGYLVRVYVQELNNV